MNKLLIWELLCIALVWSVFCRSAMVDITTRPIVRLALRLLGLAAVAGMGIPLYGFEPTWEVIGIAAGAVCVQAITARNWRHGVPVHFIQDVHRPERRAGDTP